MDSILRIRATEGLLPFSPSKWSEVYEEVVDLKRQMNILKEAYDEMRKWCTYVESHNQAMVGILEEDKAIMLKHQEKDGYYREKYLKLVISSNDLIEKIPRSLKEVEFMASIFKPQKEISDFLKMYRHMVDEFRARIKEQC